MKLVAGLGNPGPRYDGTRHNVGFEVVEELARRWRVAPLKFDRHFEGLVGEGQCGTERVMLLRPMTFMNLSGRSVSAAGKFYKVGPEATLVAYDELDLPVGQIRVRASGSAGGHRGMTDVLSALGSQSVPRIRLGIGKVHRSATVEHVLSRFDPQEREEMDRVVAIAADAVECWLREGIESAMNKYNRRPDVSDGNGGKGQDKRSQGESS